MSNKVLRWIIYITGAFCFYIFLSVRILPLFNAILVEKYVPEYFENTKWGELYYFNYIKNFREKNLPPGSIKYRYSKKHPQLNNADILLFGDSFFDFTRMTTFPEQLADSLKIRVYYARDDRPLQYLKENNYVKSTPKYLIYETAERFFIDRFEKEQTFLPADDTLTGIRKIYTKFMNFVFVPDAELVYDQLLCRSYFTSDIHSAINTLKFNLFGSITSQTPVYSTSYERPWLFVESEVSETPRGYYYKHSPDEINNYCNNIEALAEDLKNHYNLQLIFMVIPSKFTIYNNLVGVPDTAYGNFIPELYSELEKRGIPVINTFDDYRSHRTEKLLYYGTDTHWTEEGLRIALTNTLRILDTVQMNYFSASCNTKTENNLFQNTQN